MGCSSSKNDNLPCDPAAGIKPSDIKTPDAMAVCKFIEPLAPEPELEPEPEPEPPAALIPCGAYTLDGAAAACLDCPSGWLSRKADGRTYYFCSATGTSQWERPQGAARTHADPSCTCGCLKSDHVVCGDCEPVGDSGICKCGFPKIDHSPCSHYRINMSAANFGDCKCGFGKDEHQASAFAGGAKKDLQKQTSAGLRAGMLQKHYADCAKYRVNLESCNFGECMCGKPKAEHSPEALAKNAIAGQQAGTTNRDAGELRGKMVQRQKVECARYSPNLTSGEFGTCTCGAKRAEHTDAALAADTGAKAAIKQDADDVRAGFVQRVVVDCIRFELNMDPSAGFGMCTCGAKRADHTDAALAADNGPHALTKKTSAEVREAMAAKQDQIGTTVETQGAKAGRQYGIGNSIHTAAEEEAKIQAAINARAGGAEKAAALNEFNEMMKDATA